MGQIRILKVLIEETRFRKVVLDISRFISHTLRLSWAAAFAQHTFCLTNTRAAGEQKNCQKEDKNKIHKYRRNYSSKLGSNLNTFLLGTKEWPGNRNPKNTIIIEVSDQNKIYILLLSQYYNANTKNGKFRLLPVCTRPKGPQNSVRLY